MSEWKEKHCFTESVFDEGNVARPYLRKILWEPTVR